METMRGILCALVTPLSENEDIDLDASARLTEYVVGGGVDGLLALGSTGEQIALTRGNKTAFLSAVRGSMPKTMPLIAGCGSTSTRLAIQNIADAQKAGADAVILTLPCFYPSGDDGMVRYFSEAAQAADVPVYLYNISRFVGSKIGLGAVRRLMDNPRIAGIKESDRDEEYFAALLAMAKENRPDFNVIQGSDRLFLTSFRQGCGAGVTVIGNLAPAIAPMLWQAFGKGDILQAEALQSRLLEYVSLVTMFGMFPGELKYCISLKGICRAVMTSPFAPLTGGQRVKLTAAMEQLEQQDKD